MKCKLLVAEDELIERKVLCKTLQKYLGDLISLYEAKNGREAMELFAREAPQVAVLDIEMPGFTGLEVARKIRETDKNCAILFLTGFDKFDYARQAISVRAMEYLLKPYNEQELVFAVEEAIRQVSVQLPARPAILGCLLLQAVQAVLQGELFGLPERIPGEQGPPADAGPAPEHEGHRCCCGLQRCQLFYKGVQAPDGPDPFGVPYGRSGKSSTRIKRI